MRNLRIGYSPLSPGLSSAGDRRRIVFWAKARGHTLVTDLSANVDVILASEKSDFNSSFFSKTKVPIIFDLVDAYLSPLDAANDLLRGVAKHVSREISGVIKPFSHHIRDFCVKSNAVICSSIEQQIIIGDLNRNIHVILDSHDEIPFVSNTDSKFRTSDSHRIIWEGQPATIEGINLVAHALKDVSKETNLKLHFVTDEKYFLILNKYLERKTLPLIERSLGKFLGEITLTSWSPENLVNGAKNSSVAMIPINLNVPMQRLKPENRLLIMWRLGLPCLTSPSPAYIRVAEQAGVIAVCNNTEEWVLNFNRILNDPIFAKNQVEAGQNYVHENHNQNILLKKWDSAFESVMG